MKRRAAGKALAVAVLAATGWAGAEPSKQGSAKAHAGHALELMVLHATNEGKGVDKRIGELPQLTKAPFSAYDSYSLMSRAALPLTQDADRVHRLPNRRLLKLRLLQVLEQNTFRISASVNRPDGKDFLPLLEVKSKVGQPFIVAGQSHKDGVLVLVFRMLR